MTSLGKGIGIGCLVFVALGLFGAVGGVAIAGMALAHGVLLPAL